jgi:hypothetical protein
LDRFKEPNEDDIAEFSTCAGCGEIIYVGDTYDDHFGMLGCGKRECLLKITGTVERVAEDDESF